MERLQFIKDALEERKHDGLFRQFYRPGDGVDFCSNDYLGLAAVTPTPELLKHHGGQGTGASRLISGNHAQADELEQWLAGTWAAEAALWYGSGYLANLGLFSCIAGRHDTILYDELVHASIREGLRLSNASAFSFRHNNLEHLAEKASLAKGRVFVVVESVYSMDGDSPDMDLLVKLCRERGWYLIVDEAHSLGVFGESGKGHTFNPNWADVLLARILTFGKAAGYHGAVVLGSALLRDYLIQFSRPLIYTTATPASDFITIKFKLERLLEANQERERLQQNIHHFKRRCDGSKIGLISSESAIQSVICGSNDAALRLTQALGDAGFEVRAVRSPTVKAGTERIRIILHSFNTAEQIDRLVEALSNYKIWMKNS